MLSWVAVEPMLEVLIFLVSSTTGKQTLGGPLLPQSRSTLLSPPGCGRSVAGLRVDAMRNLVSTAAHLGPCLVRLTDSRKMTVVHRHELQ